VEKSGPRVQKFSTDYLAAPLTEVADSLAAFRHSLAVSSTGSRSWLVGIVEVVIIGSLVLVRSTLAARRILDCATPLWWEIIATNSQSWLAESWICATLARNHRHLQPKWHRPHGRYFCQLRSGALGGRLCRQPVRHHVHQNDDKGRGLLASAFVAILCFGYIASLTAPLGFFWASYAAATLAALVLNTFIYPLACYFAAKWFAQAANRCTEACRGRLLLAVER